MLKKICDSALNPSCCIIRLKTHYGSYEPTLQQLRQKYENAMKEKMLTKLERDRAVGQIAGLQSTLKSLEASRNGSAVSNLMTGEHFINYIVTWWKFWN